MKEYVKPTIEVTALASSTPIAAKSCSGNDQNDYDFIAREVRDEFGEIFVDYIWTNGSN